MTGCSGAREKERERALREDESHPTAAILLSPPSQARRNFFDQLMRSPRGTTEETMERRRGAALVVVFSLFVLPPGRDYSRFRDLTRAGLPVDISELKKEEAVEADATIGRARLTDKTRSRTLCSRKVISVALPLPPPSAPSPFPDDLSRISLTGM